MTIQSLYIHKFKNLPARISATVGGAQTGNEAND